MKQQIIVIGLGQFGMALAKSLAEKGAEVLAVDMKRNLVDEASEFASEAVALNAAEESELARLKPGKRDVAVCAIGEESKESSIICTALLKQMGTPLVVARANDPMHERILKLVGANQVVSPEIEFGQRFANRLYYRSMVSSTSFGDDLQLTEISVQKSMIGKTLLELELPKKYNVMVVAVRSGNPPHLSSPSPTDALRESDNLIIASSLEAITHLLENM